MKGIEVLNYFSNLSKGKGMDIEGWMMEIAMTAKNASGAKDAKGWKVNTIKRKR